MNTHALCENAQENYGWDAEKVRRLVAFLGLRNLYKNHAPDAAAKAAIDEFVAKESAAQPKAEAAPPASTP